MEQIDGKAKPGSMVYITNILDYKRCKPSGQATGENGVCVGEDQYIGFGAMYKRGALSLRSIEEESCREFCRGDNVEKFQGEHEKLARLFSESPEKFVTQRRAEQQKHCNFHFVFDGALVQEFKKTKQLDW
jgi:hypothetical protein